MEPTRTVQAKLALGFALGPIILAIVGWIAYSDTRGLVDSSDQREHAFEVLLTTAEVTRLAIDAETGQRGFLLTANDAYLEPYRNATGALTAAISHLGELTAENPRQQARVETLQQLARDKVAELAETISLRRDKGFDAALGVVTSDRGKKTMDSIRDVIGQIQHEEREILAQRSAEADRLAQLTFTSIALGTPISFMQLAVVGFFITRAVTVPVNRAVAALASASAEILAGTTQQAAGMREHSSAVTATVSTVDEVLQTSEQAAQRAVAVSESAQHAAELGATGRTAVENSIAAMGTVKEQTGSIAENILTLAEQAQAIGEIITAVNDIAEQINVLSLNAAIEASRAGEHGRGFGVVASEVKALADQSKRATAQVRQILSEIQKATNSAVIVTEQGTKGVNDAIKTVTEAGGTIRRLAEIITEAAKAASQIAASSGQQATGMRQIQQAMHNINLVSAQQVAATSQSEQAAKQLHVLGTDLRRMVAG